MVKIKICGVRDVLGAQACEDAQVDFVGFNFVTKRRRAISPDTAKVLAQHCPQAQYVGVFYNQTRDEILHASASAGLDFAQLHGDESPELCQAIAEKIPVIKVITIRENFDPGILDAYRPHVRHWLFDAPSAGEGKTFDWSQLARLELDHPFFLAGGLHADNVGPAIEQIQPNAVDTASGVEVDGRQCPDRIQAFCRAVRASSETKR